MSCATLPRFLLEPVVRAALEEDLGRRGDITSNALIGPSCRAKAGVIARDAGVLAGLEAAVLAFKLLDEDMVIETVRAAGERFEAGANILLLEGRARAILGAERVSLEFLARLSGVATATATAVAAIAGTKARICCTRKTTPGLRVLEKNAVRLGGGVNHRFGLDDAMLIKDNHLELYRRQDKGGISSVLEVARASAGPLVAIEIEVDDLAQLDEALQAGAECILLDNMSNAELARAVEITAGRAILEASGGIKVERLAEVAQTGVDFISLGALTHSSPALDFALEVTASR